MSKIPTNEDPIITIKGAVGDITVVGDVSDLPNLISALEGLQRAYDIPEKSGEYVRGWNDSIKHHTGPQPPDGYRGPDGLNDTDYRKGWNDAWDFLQERK